MENESQPALTNPDIPELLDTLLKATKGANLRWKRGADCLKTTIPGPLRVQFSTTLTLAGKEVWRSFTMTTTRGREFFRATPLASIEIADRLNQLFMIAVTKVPPAVTGLTHVKAPKLKKRPNDV